MPLDLVIFGLDGAPADVVGIRAMVHERMMAVAKSRSAGLLLRLADFYADAEYESSELPTLRTEVAAVLREVGEDGELMSVLTQINELVDRAMREGRGVSAIAD